MWLAAYTLEGRIQGGIMATTKPDAVQPRERSKIAFPYDDLDDAVQVAKAVYQDHGIGGCTLKELAPLVNSTVASSAFRVKVATARTFGVLEKSQEKAVLTELGQRLVDQVGAPQAKIDAFLSVPLFAELFKQYEGKN